MLARVRTVGAVAELRAAAATLKADLPSDVGPLRDRRRSGGQRADRGGRRRRRVDRSLGDRPRSVEGRKPARVGRLAGALLGDGRPGDRRGGRQDRDRADLAGQVWRSRPPGPDPGAPGRRDRDPPRRGTDRLAAVALDHPAPPPPRRGDRDRAGRGRSDAARRAGRTPRSARPDRSVQCHDRRAGPDPRRGTRAAGEHPPRPQDTAHGRRWVRRGAPRRDGERARASSGPARRSPRRRPG